MIELLDEQGNVIAVPGQESINESTWYPAGDIDFEGGDTTSYTTRWVDVSYDGLGALSGQNVTLRIRVWDVGDSLYDTVALIDRIEVHTS